VEHWLAVDVEGTAGEVKLRKFCKMFWAMLILFTFR